MLPFADVGSTKQHLTNCRGQKDSIVKYMNTQGEMREIMGIAKLENEMSFQFILCILHSYYISQAIVQVQLTWSIKINTVYKSRESHHIPALFTGQLESADISPYIEQITEEEPLTFNRPLTTISYFQRETKINLIICFLYENCVYNVTDLSSLLSTGLVGSSSLSRVLQPFKPFTDAPVTDACMISSYHLHQAIGFCIIFGSQVSFYH